jgi:thiamine kinase-like enzyme
MPIIDEVVNKIEDWKGKRISIQRVSGGLTNSNYIVIVEGERYFIRIPGESTELLAVDRQNEYYNTRAAAETGAGPKVHYYLPEYQVMVLEFLEGTTMTKDALNASGMPIKITQAIKKLHGGSRFFTNFNMFRLTEYYLGICKERQITTPDGYAERLPLIRGIETALNRNPLTLVPCNNDLLAENYIYDGQAIRIIDYEYSGNNDPCFELGNTCQELEYAEEQISQVCRTYFGGVLPDKIARMKLYMIMSDVGWAAIQALISKIDYNFWGWAVERWGRATEKMDSAAFPTWLEAV